MSFVDNLMDMLKNGKEEDGAATARENLSQTWGYPSLVAALPYRYYDDINEIFVNAGSAGFIMEAAPLPGANEQVMAALDDMLRKKLPRQTPVTVIMLASKCVGERIDRGVSNDMWKGGMADHLNKITRAFWQRSALHGLANEREYPLYLRNYRIFLVYGQPLKRASQTQRVIDDLVQIRNTIRVSLGAARIDSVNVDVNGFLSAVREQMNYRQEQVLTSSGDYNEDEKLNRQVVDQGIGLDVYRAVRQAAGYFSGGSVYLRNPVKNVQLISMQLPSLNAGCGGIDAYLGSFSMISGEEIQRFVKQIMSNAAGYAFDLALQTMVPELKQAKDFLQKLASDVNSMNMSSCQAAQGIIGGLWPVTQVSQQKICQDIAGETNMFADWAASRQGCTVGGQGDKVTAKAGDAEKDQVLKNKNLIWDTLSKNGLLGNDRALKELVMSTVGSIIFNKTGDVTILTPLVDNRDLIKVLMRGGTAKVYGCDEATLCSA